MLRALFLSACLVTPAMADEINIYSYRQTELIQPLLDGFTAATGITTNVAFLDKGMTERLVAEGDRSPADIVLTTDISRLIEVKEAGVTQAVTSPALDTIPANLKDAEGHWFALTVRARVIYASKDRVADGEVTTYEDLADPKWKGRICTRSGTNAYTLGLVAAYLSHHTPEETKTWLEGVKANLARKPDGSDRAQVKAIAAGECDISIGNTYYMAQMLASEEEKPWADAVRIVFPVFEGAGTHVNISGVAMTKAAPNKDAAQKFMDYLASPEAQKIYAEIVNEYPVIPGVEPSDLVKSWGALSADPLDLNTLAANRAAALKLVEEVAFDE
jgi:iron(III) transport system substrate-binding protein